MLKYGFYNSLNGDRRYDAMDMSAIFDGIINDGVFMNVGKALMVEALSDMTVKIGPGRAWFNHTWSWNIADYPIQVEPAELIYNRIDTVVLEVNSNDDVRVNSFKIIKGLPAVDPVAPEILRTEYINQYALADISIKAMVTEIGQQDITNRIGFEGTPFVTGILEILDADLILNQWTAQWNIFKEILETSIDIMTGPMGPQGPPGTPGANVASKWDMFVQSPLDYDPINTI